MFFRNKKEKGTPQKKQKAKTKKNKNGVQKATVIHCLCKEGDPK